MKYAFNFKSEEILDLYQKELDLYLSKKKNGFINWLLNKKEYSIIHKFKNNTQRFNHYIKVKNNRIIFIHDNFRVYLKAVENENMTYSLAIDISIENHCDVSKENYWFLNPIYFIEILLISKFLLLNNCRSSMSILQKGLKYALLKGSNILLLNIVTINNENIVIHDLNVRQILRDMINRAYVSLIKNNNKLNIHDRYERGMIISLYDLVDENEFLDWTYKYLYK